MEVWQNKIRHLRSFLRGWAKDQSSFYKKEKASLLDIIDRLDIKAETIPLSMAEREELSKANDKIVSLRRDEESNGLRGPI